MEAHVGTLLWQSAAETTRHVGDHRKMGRWYDLLVRQLCGGDKHLLFDKKYTYIYMYILVDNFMPSIKVYTLAKVYL